MKQVRIGVIGLGMGFSHAKSLASGAIAGAKLTAVCDINPAKQQAAAETLPADVKVWSDAEAMAASGEVDAVVIATPHYGHPQEAIRCLNKGLHVLIEKPAGVYTKQVRELNKVAADSGKVFSIMYNQRCNPLYKKLRELIAAGELGKSAAPTGLSPIGTAPRAITIPEDGGQPGPAKAAACLSTNPRISLTYGSGRPA